MKFSSRNILCKNFFVDRGLLLLVILCFNFRGLGQPQKYFDYKNFQIYLPVLSVNYLHFTTKEFRMSCLSALITFNHVHLWEDKKHKALHLSKMHYILSGEVLSSTWEWIRVGIQRRFLTVYGPQDEPCLQLHRRYIHRKLFIVNTMQGVVLEIILIHCASITLIWNIKIISKLRNL